MVIDEEEVQRITEQTRILRDAILDTMHEVTSQHDISANTCIGTLLIILSDMAAHFHVPKELLQEAIRDLYTMNTHRALKSDMSSPLKKGKPS